MPHMLGRGRGHVEAAKKKRGDGASYGEGWASGGGEQVRGATQRGW